MAKATQEEVERAQQLGAEAFANGDQCIPALNQPIMDMLTGRRVGESVALLTAWQRGWMQANRATLVMDDTGDQSG